MNEPTWQDWTAPPDKATSETQRADRYRRMYEEAEAERDRFFAALQDIAEHGLRADLNPTAPMHDTEVLYDHLVSYLRRCDAGIREQARRALTAPP